MAIGIKPIEVFSGPRCLSDNMLISLSIQRPYLDGEAEILGKLGSVFDLFSPDGAARDTLRRGPGMLILHLSTCHTSIIIMSITGRNHINSCFGTFSGRDSSKST